MGREVSKACAETFKHCCLEMGGKNVIIVMDDGRIVQRGTHAELMKVPGPYLHVASLQLVDSRELQALELKGGAA